MASSTGSTQDKTKLRQLFLQYFMRKGSTQEEIKPRELFLKYFMRKGPYMTDEEVKHACDTYPEKSLERIGTPEEDTVLHIASRLEKKKLVLQLLEIVPNNRDHRLAHAKNKRGNNVLHEVVVSDFMKKVAEKMLDMDSSLLAGRNELGETPIFCAARYGQLEMFKLLEQRQTGVDVNQALKRGDGTTALHISINTESFELALHIAEKYPELIEEKDPDSMTALQLLACNPTPFEKYKKNKSRKEFMQELISRRRNSEILDFNRGPMKFIFEEVVQPVEDLIEDVRSRIAGERNPLGKLVKLLVEKDKSWEVTGVNSQEVEEEYNDGNVPNKGKDDQKASTGEKDDKSQVPALLLATISNIEVIVEEIIKQHPEALGCTNKKGQNILHLAILYGNSDIFNVVIQAEYLMSSLLSAVDKEGNSILHMFGSEERISQSSEKMQCPALQLRKELKLFKEVKSGCKGHLTKRLNNDKQTAEELFAAKNENLHREAKEWLMRTTENCAIQCVFIATVAFAAAYTVPGGPDQKTGIPILCSKPWFVVFIVSDVISLTLALTSVGLFLSIITSSFALQDFETILFGKLGRGMITMILSISMMAVAFGATVVLFWKDAAWAAVGFLPVPIFFLSYSPLRSAVIEWIKSWPQRLLYGFFYILVTCLLVCIFPPCFVFGYVQAAYYDIVRGNKSGAKSDDQDLNQTPTDAAPLSDDV